MLKYENKKILGKQISERVTISIRRNIREEVNENQHQQLEEVDINVSNSEETKKILHDSKLNSSCIGQAMMKRMETRNTN